MFFFFFTWKREKVQEVRNFFNRKTWLIFEKLRIDWLRWTVYFLSFFFFFGRKLVNLWKSHCIWRGVDYTEFEKENFPFFFVFFFWFSFKDFIFENQKISIDYEKKRCKMIIFVQNGDLFFKWMGLLCFWFFVFLFLFYFCKAFSRNWL